MHLNSLICSGEMGTVPSCCVVGAMFGVAFLDPFSLICAFECLEMNTFRV